MTRKKWTTEEQEAWLDGHKAAYIKANQSRNAAKEFFPEMTKAFRKKWPPRAPTEAEIADAQTVEMAARVIQLAYDKRTCLWFPNNTRTLSTKGKTRGVLNLKPQPSPRTLQLWQAYQAMTYKTQWKPHIDKLWAEYKSAWEAEHGPGVKPAKSRLEINAEFMKEKLEGETPEMKEKCERYRRPTTRVEVSPSPVKTEAEINNSYQIAIDLLPRTLSSMSQSLMQQTGWHIMILAGGPEPASEGKIVTYISHAGKTTTGLNFMDFLGKNEYEVNVLKPFNRFLHASFTPAIRDSRSLFSSDSKAVGEEDVSNQGKEGEQQLKKGETEEGKSKEGEMERKKENGGIEGEKESEGGGEKAGECENKKGGEEEEENIEPRTIHKPNTGPSEYEISKQKNVAQLKELLADLEKTNPLPAEFVNAKKAISKRSPTTKKKAERTSGQRVSTRSSLSITSVPPEELPVSPPASTEHVNEVEQPAHTETDTSVQGAPRVDVAFEPSLSKAPIPPPASSPAKQIISTALIDLPLYRNSSKDDNTVGTTSLAEHQCQPANSELPQVDSQVSPHPVPGLSSDNSIGADVDIQGVEEDDAEKEATTMDVRMANPDTEVAPKPQNDDNLPSWLASMIDYLRGVSQNTAWQDLITEFVTFERCAPPSGNLPTKLRPKEISDWIKSKKKDVIPALDPQDYGKRFNAWWDKLQPAWRIANPNVSTVRFRDTPVTETWQTLRKGGTAGIYVAIMGLSWWVVALSGEHDINAWTIVDDILWVIQQWQAKPLPDSPPKRGREDDEGIEGRTRKSRRVAN